MSGVWELYLGSDGGDLSDCAVCEEFAQWALWGVSSNGKCEVDKEVDCGWQLIMDRLKELGQLDRYEEIIPVKDWTTSRDGGPRKRMREDLKL